MNETGLVTIFSIVRTTPFRVFGGLDLRSFLTGVASVVACTWAGTPASAQLAQENVLMRVPAGFKLGYNQKAAQGSIMEYVRDGETVEDWTQLLTLRITFLDRQSVDAKVEAMKQVGAGLCSGNESTPTIKGRVNGYDFAAWVDHCPLNVRTGKTEWTVIKVIGGVDSSYVVMRAFRFEPPNEQLKQAIEDVRATSVCDTRTPEHPCPPGTR